MPEGKTKILGKLHAIMSEIGYLKKDKKNEAQGFTYLSEAALKEKLNPLLIKHKVLFTTSLDYTSTTQQGTTKSGTPQFLTLASYKAIFLDAESGESFEFLVGGNGMDTQDKGIYKAHTGALKYAITTMFLIPTGDDAEEKKHKKDLPGNGNLATTEQKAEIDKLANELGWTKAELVQKCRETYKVPYSDLTNVQAQGIIGGLKKRITEKEVRV